MFKNFGDLVEHAKNLGATHVSMGNYHSGAFWIYEVPEALRHEPENEIDRLMREDFIEICGGREKFFRPRLERIAHFHDSLDYHDWEMSGFMDVWGMDQPTSQFIPIDQAVEWYSLWNKYYSET